MAKLVELENGMREVEVTTTVVEDQAGTLLSIAHRQEDEMVRQRIQLRDLMDVVAFVGRGVFATLGLVISSSVSMSVTVRQWATGT